MRGARIRFGDPEIVDEPRNGRRVHVGDRHLGPAADQPPDQGRTHLPHARNHHVQVGEAFRAPQVGGHGPHRRPHSLGGGVGRVARPAQDR